LATKIGIDLPPQLFPIPFLALYIVLLPFEAGFFVSNVASCLVGCCYFLGMLKPVIYNLDYLVAIESSGVFGMFVKRSNFVPTPGNFT
jgi:thiamine transporter ThiT